VPTASPTRTPLIYFRSPTSSYTAAQAAAYCASQGGQLANILSASEHSAANTAAAGQDCWTAGTDAITEGTFLWGNGLSSTGIYSAWASAEPGGGTAENCIAFNGAEAIPNWRDWSCTVVKYALCENRGPHFFMVTGASVTWAAGKTACNNVGAQLATILSASDRNLIIKAQNTPTPQVVWIGYTDDSSAGTTEGNYKWSSNLPTISGQTYWNTGEPNNAGGNENCAEQATTGGWNDINCVTTTHFPMCERRTGPNYFIIKTLQTWTAAKSACAAYGGSLATIRTEAERNRAYLAQENNAVWIGYTDDSSQGTTEGNWVWTSGLPTGSTFWNGGEPNNAGGSENCAIQLTTGLWNDASCSNTAYALCEIRT
jgi:hypothetical protein